MHDLIVPSPVGLGDLDLLGDLSGLQLGGAPAAPIGGQPFGGVGGGALFGGPAPAAAAGLGGLGGLDLFGGGVSAVSSGFYSAPSTVSLNLVCPHSNSCI